MDIEKIHEYVKSSKSMNEFLEKNKYRTKIILILHII